MLTQLSLLNSLTMQARSGDAAAALRLRRELEPTVLVMVRETMQPNGTKTPLDRRIRAEARKVGLSNAGPMSADRDRLINQVAQDVCRAWIAEIGSPSRRAQPLADTVAVSTAPSVAMSS